MSREFGTIGGRPIRLYTLTNRHGVELEVMEYGGIVRSLRVPDRHGRFDNVVLGCATLESYRQDSPYFGALIGRVSNRIARGRFELDGRLYSDLAVNNGVNCLHGGAEGFDKKVWKARERSTPEGTALELRYTSPDREEGFPGEVEATVLYTLTHDNRFRIDYHATTDKPTPVALTHHGYFNLLGEASGKTILGHHLRLHAEHFTPVDSTLIPTGEIRPVAGTPMDFRELRAIGEQVDTPDAQLQHAGGYDHNWVLNGPSGEQLRLAAEVVEPETGRTFSVWTDLPGIQFYGGNFLDGKLAGTSGVAYPFRGGFCLETQQFPNAVNQPGFPSPVIRPGQAFRSRTEYRFGIQTP